MSQTLNVITNQVFNKSYLIDLNSNYTLDTGPLQLTNVNAINDMIINVLLTSPGERPFQPQFGSGVPQLLFNNITTQNAYTILHDIFFSVQKFVPGVTISVADSNVYADMSNGTYYFVLSYSVEGLPGVQTSNITLSPSQ
jgi:phage baseplate assembly protein W